MPVPGQERRRGPGPWPVGPLLVLALLVVWFQAGRPSLLPTAEVTHEPAVLATLELPSAASGSGSAPIEGRPLFDGAPLPEPPPSARAERLLPAVDPGPGGPHVFMQLTADGQPILLDPCRALDYVVRTDGMPAEVLDAIRAAAITISTASGLVVAEIGAVDEMPTVDRAPLQPDRYPNRWAPVLFAWSTPDEYPSLTDSVAALGGGQVIDLGTPGTARIVTGSVILNADVLESRLDTVDDRKYLELVVTHELAHVVGLGHVDDTAQLMDARPIEVSELGTGDRAGLAAAGQGACHGDT